MGSFAGTHLPKAGQYTRLIHPAVKGMPVHVYRPKSVKHPHDLLVAVHGISRNAQQQVTGYKALADELGLWLIAPEFSKELFPKYQQLAKTGSDLRADLSLNTFLLAWEEHQGINKVRIHLCGYSGGAQFAHRYALVYPEAVNSLVLSSAGWYTFPDNEKYPRGLNRWPKWLRPPKLKDLLSIPLLVLVGSEDTERSQSLNTSAAVDLQQGINRLERAKNWFQGIQAKRKLLNIQTVTELQLLVRQGHDFGENAAQSPMLKHIEGFISFNLNRDEG